MSRPEDIPEDVWEAAISEAEHALTVSIAHTILVERERCAKVADANVSMGGQWATAASTIAVAIRKGGAA